MDNPKKASKFNFNDGFNYLILHSFDNNILNKFYADKELIESFQLSYVSGEKNGRYVEIDEDYQHENIL